MILPLLEQIAFRILFAAGVHSITAIYPVLSATKILQLEAIGNFISKKIASCAVSAFSSRYRTIKHELKPACILSRLVNTKVIATAKPCSFTGKPGYKKPGNHNHCSPLSPCISFAAFFKLQAPRMPQMLKVIFSSAFVVWIFQY